MKCGSGILYLLIFLQISIGLSIDMLVNEQPRTRACIGDLVKLVCRNYTSSQFVWSISPIVGMNTTIRVDQTTSHQIVRSFDTKFISNYESTLAFVTQKKYDNMIISCSDESGENPLSRITFRVYGLLMTPKVIVSHNSTSTLTLIIYQPGDDAVCVREYDVTVSSSDFQYKVKVAAVLQSRTHVDIENLNLCKYNYTILVSAIDVNRDENTTPFVMTGNLSFEAYLYQFCFRFENGIVIWNVPSQFSDCIIGFEYRFEKSGWTGELPSSATNLSLNSFNISSPCNFESLVMSPLLDVQPYSTNSSRVKLLVLTGNSQPEWMNTESITNPLQQLQNQNHCNNYTTAMISISLTGLFIVIILIVVVIVLVLKLKKLRELFVIGAGTTVIQDTKKLYTKKTTEKPCTQKETEKPHTQKKKFPRKISDISGIATTGCEAYKVVSVGLLNEENSETSYSPYEPY